MHRLYSVLDLGLCRRVWAQLEGTEMMVAVRTGDRDGEGAGQAERRIKDHWAGWTVAATVLPLACSPTHAGRRAESSSLEAVVAMMERWPMASASSLRLPPVARSDAALKRF